MGFIFFDILAYIGALYVDRDLEYCQVFAEVCFFPRLKVTK